jgi:hypothetical protein
VSEWKTLAAVNPDGGNNSSIAGASFQYLATWIYLRNLTALFHQSNLFVEYQQTMPGSPPGTPCIRMLAIAVPLTSACGLERP